MGLAALAGEAARCERCALWHSRTRSVFGAGPARAAVLLVGEAPGVMEDETGAPFIGPSGQFLRTVLRDAGVPPAYLCNAVKCHPPGNRAPTGGEVAACARFLDGQIAAVQPALIVCLGDTAAQAVLGWTGGIATARDQVLTRGGARVLITLHPAAALRSRTGRALLAADLRTAAGMAGAAVVAKAARLGPEAFLRQANRLARSLRFATNPTVRQELRASLDQLMAVHYETASAAEIDFAIDGLNARLRRIWDRLPPGTPNDMTTSFGVTMERVGTGTRAAMRRTFQLPVSTVMNYVDRTAADHLVGSQTLFVRDAYGAIADRASDYARRIVAGGLEQGLGGATIAQDLQAKLGMTYAAHQQGYYSMIANVFTGRARSWSQVTTYNDARVERYRVLAVLDEVTTEMCRAMNGKIIPVGASYEHMRAAMTLPDPADIKYQSPWLTTKKEQVGFVDREGSFNVIARRDGDAWQGTVPDDQLVDKGIGMPPYHANCRTETVLE